MRAGCITPRARLAAAVLASWIFAAGGEARAQSVADELTRAPRASQPVAAGEALRLEPILGVAGGIKADAPIQGPNEAKEARVGTVAVSRFGVRVHVDDWLTVESELMANGGISLHGTSAFEGQAALQVRNQLVRVRLGAFQGEAGRITDEASADFYSAHVADVFLQDTATRDPLLYSGYNLGNGVRGVVTLTPGVRLGLTLNGGNPVSTTGSLMVGGIFPPFDRFYIQPYQSIGKGPNHFPDDTFHIMMATPSALVSVGPMDLRFALQGFVVNTDMTKGADDPIRGVNLRGALRLRLLDGALVPFANVALVRNDTVSPTDVSQITGDKYTGLTTGAGVDVNLGTRFRCPWTCADGLGAQYVLVQYRTGSGPTSRLHYANLGATVWASSRLSFGARVALALAVQPDVPTTGELAGFLTTRFLL